MNIIKHSLCFLTVSLLSTSSLCHSQSPLMPSSSWLLPESLLQRMAPLDPRLKTTMSVLMVSLPSLPLFLLLVFILQLVKGKTKQSKGESVMTFINKHLSNKMICICCGTLMADIFMHVLPLFYQLQSHSDSSSSSSEHVHSSDNLFIILGVAVFWVIDQAIKLIKQGSHKQNNHSVVVFLLGDFFHNLGDGLALGAAYQISDKVGIVTTFAIFLHEIPHEMGDFAQLFKYKCSIQQVFMSQVITSAGAFIGGIIGCQFGEIYKMELLGFTAGSFLYITFCVILDDIKQDVKSGWQLISTIFYICLGITFMLF